MAIWLLNKGTGFTTFEFPLMEHKVWFEKIFEEYFEESKSAKSIWKKIVLLSGEPKRKSDFIGIPNTDAIGISQIAYNELIEFFDDGVELLPVDTDKGVFFLLNVLNIVDCLDKENSEYNALPSGIITDFKQLDFYKEKLGKIHFFKIPELPFHIFVSDAFQHMYSQIEFAGLEFDENTTLIWYEE